MEINFKNKEKIGKLATILLVGVLLLVIALPSGNGTDSGESSETALNDYASKADYYEKKLKTILENSYGEGTMEVMVYLDGNGQSDNFYSSGSEGELSGVLVVADVDDEQAVSDITFAVCALFDLPTHKVAVIIRREKTPASIGDE